ncbi:PAS domain S-box protein [Bacteroidota bacterium]
MRRVSIHMPVLSNKDWSYLISVLAGILFLLLSVIIITVSTGLHFSLVNFIQIHKLHTEIILLYLLPVLFPVLVNIHFRRKEKDRAHYLKIINQRDDTINRNAKFAKEIGEGNYSVHIIPHKETDILGKSLLVMKENLLANHLKESEQNWISEGQNLISNILRMYNKLEELGDHVLEHLVKYIDAIQGAIFLYNEENDTLVNLSTYAYNRKKYITQEFKVGYGLIGQCAYERDYIYRTEIPEDYFTIKSGLIGEKKPSSLLIVPLISEEMLQGVVEICSLNPEIPEQSITLVKELGSIIARTVFNLRVNQRTERLLEESQKMTNELRNNEEQLKESAEEMRVTQEELKLSNEQLESQVQEVENAQKRLHWLLENASEIISIYDKNLRNTYTSPSVTRILGYTPEELMKGKDFERLTLEGQEQFKTLFEDIVKDPSLTPTFEYTYVRKDGKQVSLESKARNLLDDPAVNGIILNTSDITERRRREKEERIRTRMQSLSENSLDMIIRLSSDGQFFYANPVVEDYLGKNPSDLINKRLSELELPALLKEYFEMTIIAVKDSPRKSNYELIIPVKTGEKSIERIMNMVAIPEFNEGELETILIVGHDITEAKRIEKEIQVKNRKIEDSINYAERIQSSILPGIKQIQEHLSNCFIYYKPRDVISGDFPWFFPKTEDLIYIAAVDCTGHGVPGALLSFIGYFVLSNIVDHDREYTSGEICDRLHAGVRQTLKQESEEADARDGMDIAFCRIDKASHEIQYAGAHRPLYLLRNGEILEFKGDRKAIGGIPSRRRAEQPFTNHVISYEPGDKIFFFTDGMPDQLGGEENRKYSPKRVRDAILENPGLTMNQYKSLFMRDFEDWMKNAKQIDDVLLIGIEF